MHRFWNQEKIILLKKLFREKINNSEKLFIYKERSLSKTKGDPLPPIYTHS